VENTSAAAGPPLESAAWRGWGRLRGIPVRCRLDPGPTAPADPAAPAGSTGAPTGRDRGSRPASFDGCPARRGRRRGAGDATPARRRGYDGSSCRCRGRPWPRSSVAAAARDCHRRGRRRPWLPSPRPPPPMTAIAVAAVVPGRRPWLPSPWPPPPVAAIAAAAAAVPGELRPVECASAQPAGGVPAGRSAAPVPGRGTGGRRAPAAVECRGGGRGPDSASLCRPPARAVHACARCDLRPALGGFRDRRPAPCGRCGDSAEGRAERGPPGAGSECRRSRPAPASRPACSGPSRQRFGPRPGASSGSADLAFETLSGGSRAHGPTL